MPRPRGRATAAEQEQVAELEVGSVSGPWAPGTVRSRRFGADERAVRQSRRFAGKRRDRIERGPGKRRVQVASVDGRNGAVRVGVSNDDQLGHAIPAGARIGEADGAASGQGDPLLAGATDQLLERDEERLHLGRHDDARLRGDEDEVDAPADTLVVDRSVGECAPRRGEKSEDRLVHQGMDPIAQRECAGSVDGHQAEAAPERDGISRPQLERDMGVPHLDGADRGRVDPDRGRDRAPGEATLQAEPAERAPRVLRCFDGVAPPIEDDLAAEAGSGGAKSSRHAGPYPGGELGGGSCAAERARGRRRHQSPRAPSIRPRRGLRGAAPARYVIYWSTSPLSDAHQVLCKLRGPHHAPPAAMTTAPITEAGR